MGNETTELTPVILLKALLGAVIGSLPAMLLWVVLGRVGIVAALAGFFMIMGELIACDRFTKSSTNMNIPAAIIICGAVMLVNIFICEKIIWAWDLSSAMNEYGMETSILDCLANFNDLLEALEAKEDFTASLVQSYLYGILGAVAGVFKLTRGNSGN